VHIGVGGFVILLILSVVFKKDFFSLLGGQGVSPGQAVSQPDPQRDAREEPLVQFVSFVLDDTQKNMGGNSAGKRNSLPAREAGVVP
jgi:predicted metalloprotease